MVGSNPRTHEMAATHIVFIEHAGGGGGGGDEKTAHSQTPALSISAPKGSGGAADLKSAPAETPRKKPPTPRRPSGQIKKVSIVHSASDGKLSSAAGPVGSPQKAVGTAMATPSVGNYFGAHNSDGVSYVLNSILDDENRMVEFKAVQKSAIPHVAIAKYAEKNICAFLNSDFGGVLYCGVQDDGKVLGVALSQEQRDLVRRQLDSAIERYEPIPSQSLYSVRFRPVTQPKDPKNPASPQVPIPDRWVVEFAVASGRESAPVYITGQKEAWRRYEASVRLMGVPEIVERSRAFGAATSSAGAPSGGAVTISGSAPPPRSSPPAASNPIPIPVPTAHASNPNPNPNPSITVGSGGAGTPQPFDAAAMNRMIQEAVRNALSQIGYTPAAASAVTPSLPSSSPLTPPTPNQPISGWDNSGTPIGGGPPHELLCPLSLEIMTDPVLAADGITYDRRSIEEYIRSRSEGIGSHHYTLIASPTTGKPLSDLKLVSNQFVKNQIQSYLQRATNSANSNNNNSAAAASAAAKQSSS